MAKNTSTKPKGSGTKPTKKAQPTSARKGAPKAARRLKVVNPVPERPGSEAKSDTSQGDAGEAGIGIPGVGNAWAKGNPLMVVLIAFFLLWAWQGWLEKERETARLEAQRTMGAARTVPGAATVSGAAP